MNSRIGFLITLLLSCSAGRAQLNESDTVRFQLRTGLTGNYQQGNVNILTIRSRIDLSLSPGKDFVFKSQNNGLYQAFSDVKADNDFYSRNFIYYKPKKKVYPFGIAYISTNYRRKIDLRIFSGAGITWQVLNKSNLVIKLSAGAVYEASTFQGAQYNYAVYNGANSIKLWRGTLYAAGWHYLLDKHLRLFYDAYWQPAFNDKNNYRTQYEMGIDFLVWKGLSLNALYSFTHEQVTIFKVKQDDRILTFGLAYSIKIK